MARPNGSGHPTRPWWSLRWLDIVAAVGLAAFALQAVDRFVNGTAADPTLAALSAGLATGAAIGPRAIEWAARSRSESAS